MKTIKIYERETLQKTIYRNYPFKQIKQISIFFDGYEIKNHDENINNPRFKNRFIKVFDSRSIKKLNDYISNCGRTNGDKWKKEIIKRLLNNQKVERYGDFGFSTRVVKQEKTTKKLDK